MALALALALPTRAKASPVGAGSKALPQCRADSEEVPWVSAWAVGRGYLEKVMPEDKRFRVGWK